MTIRKTTEAKTGSPRRSRDETTNEIARMIIETERAEREAKTERLRQARLAQEAKTALEAPAAKEGQTARKAVGADRKKLFARLKKAV